MGKYLFLLTHGESNIKGKAGKTRGSSLNFLSFSFSRHFHSGFSKSTGYEDIRKNHRQEPKLSFLIKAIYTMAYGLQAYHEDVCGKSFIGVCPQLQKSFNHSIFFVRNEIPRKLLKIIKCILQNYLMNVSFITAENDTVEFNQDGDVLAHYDIMNFQRNADGSFAYVKIGDWNNHTLNFSDELKPPNGTVKFSSVCSKPCAKGYYKVIKTRSNKSFHTT